MSGLIAVRYSSDPIMLRYTFWSTASPSSSASKAVIVAMGVDKGLASPMSNFFRTSFVYLPWCTKVPSLVCLIWSPMKNVSSPIIDIWWCAHAGYLSSLEVDDLAELGAGLLLQR